MNALWRAWRRRRIWVRLSADIKDLEARLTRLIYAVGVGVLISVIGSIVSIALSLARLF